MRSTNRQRMLPGFENDEKTSPPPKLLKNARHSNNPGPGDVVYVVDAHSLIYQVFHALPEMTGPSGQPVGAIHGFIRDILHLRQDRKATFLFTAFDAPGETFRDELYSEYKAHREPMPDDLAAQIPNIRRMLMALRVPIMQVVGFEADDVMATIARRAETTGATCHLVTSDKDCRQLISDRITIYHIRKGQYYGVAELESEWGIRPEQVVDFQALVGDSVDNIPGVPLIGPKNARELLHTYQTLDSVLDHASELAGSKRRDNLIQFRDQALLSRQLARLDDDVPIEIDWSAGLVGGVHRDELYQLCREFGFRNLADRLSGIEAVASPIPWNVTYRSLTTEADLGSVVEQLRRQQQIVIDTETTSASPRWAELVGISFAWKEGEAYYVPIRAPQGEPRLDQQLVLDILRPVLEDPGIRKIGQNIKYDRIVLRCCGVNLNGLWFDTMVADYLLAPGERVHGLDDLARRYLGHRTIPIESLIGSGKNQRRMDEVRVDDITRYAAEDADVPLRLVKILEPRLVEDSLDQLFANLEMPLIDVLAELEYNGIRIDASRLRELSRKYGEHLRELETSIHDLAGEPFNIDSPSQLSRILFQKLKLPRGRKTQTGHSTDADVLAELVDLHPLPARVVEYRQFAKLKSGYLDALPDLVNPRTGRVHSSFKQDVAATGRLSSTDPNLQNIPIRTEAGREIRSAFLPAEGDWQLLTADYSQIELRVLAHFSGDPSLVAAFAQGADIHTRVAARVYGVAADSVSREMRRSAKAINFGVIYGQGPGGLSRALEISKDDAARFIQAYFTEFGGVATFIREVLADSRRNGYVKTILGRRRAVQGVRDPSRRSDAFQRNLPERIAINTVIQGSAADLIKQAMINIHGRIRQEKLRARMLLQIHDELVFEVPTEDIDGLAAMVRQEMISACNLSVPLVVDVKSGANWAECEPVE